MARVTEGLVFRAPDAAIEGEARRHGYTVVISADYANPFERALIVEPGTGVPWAMVPAGLHLLEVWDAAAPLLPGKDDRHTLLARDVAGANAGEMARTAKIVHDLRLPVFASEMLFVRKGEMATELIKTWRNELCHGPNQRLAFLRAFYRVKPRMCALPTVWLSGAALPESRVHARPQPGAPQNLVNVEILPGRYARCKPGEEAAVKARFDKMLGRRDGEKAVQQPPNHKARKPDMVANKGEKP